MDHFEVTVQDVETVPVFKIKGYFNADAGDKTQELAHGLFAKTVTRFVFDFSECVAINSPGVSKFVDLAFEIVDDFKGKMVLVGLNDLNTQVFSLAGILSMAQTKKTISEALQSLK